MAKNWVLEDYCLWIAPNQWLKVQRRILSKWKSNRKRTKTLKTLRFAGMDAKQHGSYWGQRQEKVLFWVDQYCNPFRREEVWSNDDANSKRVCQSSWGNEDALHSEEIVLKWGQKCLAVEEERVKGQGDGASSDSSQCLLGVRRKAKSTENGGQEGGGNLKKWNNVSLRNLWENRQKSIRKQGLLSTEFPRTTEDPPAKDCHEN